MRIITKVGNRFNNWFEMFIWNRKFTAGIGHAYTLLSCPSFSEYGKWGSGLAKAKIWTEADKFPNTVYSTSILRLSGFCQDLPCLEDMVHLMYQYCLVSNTSSPSNHATRKKGKVEKGNKYLKSMYWQVLVVISKTL